MSPAWIVPEWPAPAAVRAASTLRCGGVSPPPWHSLNLGARVGDAATRVADNRARLARALGLPAEPAWLEQVHGRQVLVLDAAELPPARTADAAVTARAGRVLAVLTADCLPVIFCAASGRRVGIAHAGWRGLAGGVLEATVAAMAVPPGELHAWLGPGIGARAYEVGPEVLQAAGAASAAIQDSFAAEAAPTAAIPAGFTPARPGRWHCDLALLARLRLEAAGVRSVHGGHWCTHSDPQRFYSHRRDGSAGPTGRMATLIWLDQP